MNEVRLLTTAAHLLMQWDRRLALRRRTIYGFPGSNRSRPGGCAVAVACGSLRERELRTWGPRTLPQPSVRVLEVRVGLSLSRSIQARLSNILPSRLSRSSGQTDNRRESPGAAIRTPLRNTGHPVGIASKASRAGR